MRAVLSALTAFVIALAPDLARPEAQSGGTPPVSTGTTVVHGSVPGLVGRWLVVAALSPQGQNLTVPVAYGWEVTAPSGTPELRFRWGGLPPSVKASLDAATNRHEPWDPTPEQLAAVSAAWDTVTPDPPGATSIDTTIADQDHEPDAIKRDPVMAGSLFTVQTLLSRAGQGAARDGIVFGARERLADGYRGNFVSTTLAAAPFPISVTFSGTARMYRLDSAPPRRLLRRMLDLFAGCGRRP